MIETPTTDLDRLARRLERFRRAGAGPGTVGDPLPHRRHGARELADRLAHAVGGEVVLGERGLHVRVERESVELPIDRARLADLPGQPPPDRPLVCLDTETTGLATAAGTVAFLIGIGWWVGDRFRVVQLLLPDHGEEGVLLDELGRHIPPDSWLVTYNGRGFDWPLLVTRYRLARRPAPEHAGHIDLLPIVRRLFRHRMVDARLGTVEHDLLGVIRHDDVDGWEIPGRYLGFLRGGPAQPLAAVVRHNDEDVRSLGRLLVHLERRLGDPSARATAPRGDLAGLARAFRRDHRFEEAIACLDAALAERSDAPASGPAVVIRPAPTPLATSRPIDEEPWWSPRRRPDFGGRPARPAGIGWDRRAAFGRPWDEVRIAVDRAHLLRRSGRTEAALEAWDALACGPGRAAIVAAIEAAKLREHRLADPVGALASVERGLTLADRRRGLGMPEPALEADLRHRWRRLRRRGSGQPASSAARTGPASASSVGRSNGAGQSNMTALRPASR
jgi:uncharacterized protein YprB with RNaseH-like and TPR domain